MSGNGFCRIRGHSTFLHFPGNIRRFSIIIFTVETADIWGNCGDGARTAISLWASVSGDREIIISDNDARFIGDIFQDFRWK